MKVVVISGPTASGKTGISIELAAKFGGEVVNFDSLLLYKEINIGTAKPTKDEQGKIPHHMVDVRSVSNPMNAADYASVAIKVIEEILSRNKTVFLVGGSGFYLQAVLKGMYNSPTTPAEIIQKSDSLYEAEGIAPFLKVLKDHDPKSLTLYHENDHYRIRRAVEHWWANKTPFSLERQDKDSSNKDLSRPTVHDWDILHIHLDLPKEEHIKIIEARTDKMIADGLEQEIRELLANGLTGKEKPMQSIGYKEMCDYIFGAYESLKECRERIVISTRQLAKSQRTWFKKDTFKKTYHPLGEREQISLAVESFLKS